MSTGTGLPLALMQQLADNLIARLSPYCQRIEVAGSVRRQKPTVGDLELVCIPKIETRAAPGQTAMFGLVAPGKTEEVNLLDDGLDGLLKTADRPIFKSVADLMAARERCRRPITFPQGVEDLRRWGPRYKRFYVYYFVAADEKKGRPQDLRGIVPVDLFITAPDSWGAIMTLRTGPKDFSTALVTHIKYGTAYKQDEGCLWRKETGEVVPVPTEESYFVAAGVPYIEPGQRTATGLRRLLAQRRAGSDKLIPSIPALSLHQPWASFIAAGFKCYETRDWTTSYRGLLAIHAAKREPEPSVKEYLTVEQRELLPDPLPRGAILCVVRLADVVSTATLTIDPAFEESQEFDLGNYAPGRYAWKLELVKVFEEPIPAVGRQGLWAWTTNVGELIAGAEAKA